MSLRCVVIAALADDVLVVIAASVALVDVVALDVHARVCISVYMRVHAP